jgi:hypothetical protein
MEFSILLGCLSDPRRVEVVEPLPARNIVANGKQARVMGSTPTTHLNFSITYGRAHAVYVPLIAKRATFPLACAISSVTTSP